MTTPTSPNPIAAAAAELSDAAGSRVVPMLDFDEDVVTVVCQVTIAGEVFDVPPMAATTVEYFMEIKDLDVDALGKDAFGVMRTFIVKCLMDADAERGMAALLRSRMTLRQLMERGGFLTQVASGFPTQPPSASALSSRNGGGSTTDDSLPAPVTGLPGPPSGPR
jgi:hypothetical protein